jgi:hypothetical protein
MPATGLINHPEVRAKVNETTKLEQVCDRGGFCRCTSKFFFQLKKAQQYVKKLEAVVHEMDLHAKREQQENSVSKYEIEVCLSG